MLSDTDTLPLVRKAKGGDNEAKEELLKACSFLMKSIVRRYLGRGTDYEDLYELACIGLLKAIDGFEEAYGAKFTTYAVPMIAGEIKRFLRDDGSMKVSRAIKEQARKISLFVSEFTQTNGRNPSVSEIGSAFSLDESEVVFLIDSGKMPLSLFSASDYKDEPTGELIERLPQKDFQDEWLEKIELKNLILGLNERERKIILLRYFRDMTQSEVAREIGVSQVQISRIEAKILASFREKL